MTLQIALTLSIVGEATVLFATEKLRVDVIALIVLLSVALTGLVGPEEVFAGFSNLEVELPIGLGARHAAAAITKHTTATAVVVSATDGNVRVFSGGKMLLQMDPVVAQNPVNKEG